ncbi:MAG: MotE family protein [bacterium]
MRYLLQDQSGKAGLSIFLFIILLSLVAGGVYMLDNMELIDAENTFYSYAESIPVVNEYLLPTPVTELEYRQEQMRERQRELEQKETHLKQVELDLREQRQEIEETEVVLNRQEEELAERELALQRRRSRFDADEERYDYLARLYSSMRPGDAAERIENIESDQVVIAILRRMEEASASIILSNMDSDRVAVITRKVAHSPG